MKPTSSTISPEVKNEAMKMAKATMKPNQTKEQTKLIAQGIEKGIALYKKQQKEKQRELNKAKKKERQAAQSHPQHEMEKNVTTEHSPINRRTVLLPWILLLITWAGILGYVALA